MGIIDGYNPSEVGRTWKMHINVLQRKGALSAFIPFSAIIESELCQTALQQLHILIIKVALSLKNVMKLQKKYGYGVIKLTLSFCDAHTIKTQYWGRQIF